LFTYIYRFSFIKKTLGTLEKSVLLKVYERSFLLGDNEIQSTLLKKYPVPGKTAGVQTLDTNVK
jgi:hypothetical protein